MSCQVKKRYSGEFSSKLGHRKYDIDSNALKTCTYHLLYYIISLINHIEMSIKINI